MELRPASGDWKDIDAGLLRLHLEFEEDFRLDLPQLLLLRREVNRAAKALAKMRSGDECRSLRLLTAPPPSDDPQVRRYLAKPPVPYVLRPVPGLPRILTAGDSLDLDFFLFGGGRELAATLIDLFVYIGECGFCNGEGKFSLSRVSVVDERGEAVAVWCPGQVWTSPQWPLFFFDREPQLLPGQRGAIRFITPARLMRRGKPLFRPSLAQLFPFIVRRVCGMCHYWCGVDLLADPGDFFANLPQEDIRGGLQWRDWRTLSGDRGEQPVGGLVGRIAVPAEWLAYGAPFFMLGARLNLGKGAACGAGAWELVLEP
ncbi:hypothetical protein EDC39_101183 [Geothermobacter ehrlichii]|uniref:CRISPR-associated protein Cas6 C-terminal domain-containing protein n=1 Tax=Geothermobacter ehrlichii TaxID=213224 RepID=A0A5D3WLV8_9BACT|nr:hypothetical protein [Geothermobacter ehrlichii]TYP00023.1 hypothetical protein EDC39_101183 [Geothermobacter ehrlichii]